MLIILFSCTVFMFVLQGHTLLIKFKKSLKVTNNINKYIKQSICILVLKKPRFKGYKTKWGLLKLILEIISNRFGDNLGYSML